MLRYKWKPSSVERFALVVENRTEIKNPVASAGPTSTTVTTETDMVQRVAGVSAGVASLESRFEGTRVAVAGPQSALASDFKRLLEKARFTVRADERGQLHGVVEAAGVPAEIRRFVESLKPMIAQLQAVFPERAVEVGDRWTTTVEGPHALPTGDSLRAKVDTTFSYEGTKEDGGRRAERVGVALTMSMTGVMRQAGVSYAVEVKGTGRGAMLFDGEAGAVVSSDVTTDIAGVWKSDRLTVQQGSKVRTRLLRK